MVQYQLPCRKEKKNTSTYIRETHKKKKRKKNYDPRLKRNERFQYYHTTHCPVTKHTIKRIMTSTTTVTTTTTTKPKNQKKMMMMNAAVYTEFGGPIQVQQIPIPDILNIPDGIIIRVMATGVCRSDYHGWKGHDQDIHQHGLPFVPGHEASGIIVKVGTNILQQQQQQQQQQQWNARSSSNNNNNHTSNPTQTDDVVLQVGDRVVVPFILSCYDCIYCCHYHRPTVCCNQLQPGFTQYGTFAEYVSIPRAKQNVVRIPDNVTFEQAAALGCRFTTAYRALIHRAGIRCTNTMMMMSTSSTLQPIPQPQVPLVPGTNNNCTTPICNTDTIAIFGCGGLGLSCIMLAKAYHVRTIIAIDISERALQKASDLGATNIIHDCTTTTTTTISANSNKKKKKKDTPPTNFVRERLYEITNGIGADVTVDAGGYRTTCENAMYCTRRGGKMIQVGLLDETDMNHDDDATTTTTNDTTTNNNNNIQQQQPQSNRPMIPMNRITGYEMDVLGSHGFEGQVDLPILLDLISKKIFDPSILIEKYCTLQEGANEIEFMEHKSPLGITMITNFQQEQSSLSDMISIESKNHHHSRL